MKAELCTQGVCPASGGPVGCWALLAAVALPCSHGLEQARVACSSHQ